jgi:membrane-bound ClpP family serine protease
MDTSISVCCSRGNLLRQKNADEVRGDEYITSSRLTVLEEETAMKKWTRWQDYVSLVLGFVLFVSPLVLAFTAHPAITWNALVVGVITVLLALWALAVPETTVPEWIIVVLGIWLFLSPWILSFATVSAAAWAAWIIGVLLVAMAALTLAQIQRLPMQHAM